MNAFKSKTLAAWLALAGGSVGAHRFYLHGGRDALAWLHALPTLVGLLGLQRFKALGQDDLMAAWALPLLGLMLAQGALFAIVYGLRSDEQWAADRSQALQATRWGPVLAAIAGLLLGGATLMAAIVFAAQRYFELDAATAASKPPMHSIA